MVFNDVDANNWYVDTTTTFFVTGYALPTAVSLNPAVIDTSTLDTLCLYLYMYVELNHYNKY